MSYIFFVTGVLILALALVTVYSGVHVVEEGNLEALLVFGQMQRVLRPGLNVAPPFVSTTYPIDPGTMTIDKGAERVDVPEEFEAEVRAAADGSPSAMAPNRTTGDYVAYLVYVVAMVGGWAGGMILAVNLELRHTAETFAGTPLDAPMWTGIVLLALFFPFVYLGNTIRRRYGTLPPDRGWF